MTHKSGVQSKNRCTTPNDTNVYKCSSGDCILAQYVCDGDVHCADGSDELGCVQYEHNKDTHLKELLENAGFRSFCIFGALIIFVGCLVHKIRRKRRRSNPHEQIVARDNNTLDTTDRFNRRHLPRESTELMNRTEDATVPPPETSTPLPQTCRLLPLDTYTGWNDNLMNIPTDNVTPRSAMDDHEHNPTMQSEPASATSGRTGRHRSSSPYLIGLVRPPLYRRHDFIDISRSRSELRPTEPINGVPASSTTPSRDASPDGQTVPMPLWQTVRPQAPTIPSDTGRFNSSNSPDRPHTSTISSSPDRPHTSMISRSPDRPHTSTISSSPDRPHTSMISSSPDRPHTSMISSSPDRLQVPTIQAGSVRRPTLSVPPTEEFAYIWTEDSNRLRQTTLNDRDQYDSPLSNSGLPPNYNVALDMPPPTTSLISQRAADSGFTATGSSTPPPAYNEALDMIVSRSSPTSPLPRPSLTNDISPPPAYNDIDTDSVPSPFVFHL